MGFDKRENARPYVPQEGDTLRRIAEREAAAGNPVTWQELARFNWGTDDEAEVNAFLRDELGARRRDADNNFVLAADDEPRGQLLIPAPFSRVGLALEKVYTLRVRKKAAPAQFLECCHVPGITFGFNSSFVRPGVVEYLKKLERVADRHQAAKIMIFGHTDAVGDDIYNKKLSERRAWSVYAFVTNDVDAWEVLYSHPDEDWGLSVVQEILADLGHYAGAIDGDWGSQTAIAIRAFRGLPEGSVVQNDAPFRKELFAAYMSSKHDIDLSPERFVEPGYMGCGEFNPLEATEGDATVNRRVTFFFVHPDRVPHLPCRYADTGPCLKQTFALDSRFKQGFRCSFYDSLARRCSGETLDPYVPCLWIRLDLSPGEAAGYHFDLELRSTDGSYAQALKVDGDAQPSGEHADLYFGDVPPQKNFTLIRRGRQDQACDVVFEDIPYHRLASLSAEVAGDDGMHDRKVGTDAQDAFDDIDVI